MALGQLVISLFVHNEGNTRGDPASIDALSRTQVSSSLTLPPHGMHVRFLNLLPANQLLDSDSSDCQAEPSAMFVISIPVGSAPRKPRVSA